MDHERFDHLARMLASARSRRSLVKALAGGAFAGLMTRAGTSPAAAQDVPAPCTTNADCDDDNPCTSNVCREGRCHFPNKRKGVSCPGDDNPCTLDICDGEGHCRHPNKRKGTRCPSDDNPCTNDICDGEGHCRHPNKREGSRCPDDGNSCTTDVCDDDGHCRHPNKPDGTRCRDDDTDHGHCRDGICLAD